MSQSSVNPKITLGGERSLTLSDVRNFIKKDCVVEIDSAMVNRMSRSQQFLRYYIDKRVPIYGINTQFGDQTYLLDGALDKETAVYYQSIKQRQENLVRSHVCGMGDSVSPHMVKVTMLLRAHCLSQGYSGVSPSVVEHIIRCLNENIVPVVPKYGSIGASGDLIPLATIAATLIGEDVLVQHNDCQLLASEAFKKTNIKPLSLSMREGLALINGTSFMTAIASVSLCHLEHLFQQILKAIGISLEAMLAVTSAYHPLVHQLKRHSGQIEVAVFLRHFWEGSQLLSNLGKLEESISKESNTDDAFRRIQNYYSLRSVAQGFGPFKENIDRAILWVENEMNSVNDNPVVDVDEKQLLNNANFMGYYITDACDILKMNIGQASTWIHALLANLVHPRKNGYLPANLVENPEIHNGFRPLQLLAASLAVQNRKLAQSHQAYSLPTEGDNQDVNSLGTHAALDLYDSIENLYSLTAILLLAGVQALELRGYKKASPAAQKIYETVRQHSKTVKICRPMQGDLNTIVSLLKENKV